MGQPKIPKWAWQLFGSELRREFEQLEETLKHVQEVVIHAAGKKMKATEHQPKGLNTNHHLDNQRPQRDASALQSRDARRVIEAKQALRRAHNSVTPSRSVMTPYMSKRNPLVLVTRKREALRKEFHHHLDNKNNDTDRNTEIIATVIGRIDDKEFNAGYQKAQI
ncbi:LOW QUALITY PROTEIN: hypothetical protein Cgig2_029711 [Carnegiea gigantea]|uniref:Uncharacterized protein n=1 Tax=Carnegiea gigantea TaxID=171969 RepID=A0A9Q1JMP3_9CARY|nr:LOW QUALITY PROTEIN: hypothetical protein Cgig2_029711 [Carnegiea gigantea]